MKKLVLFAMIALCTFNFDASAQRKRQRTATSQGNFVVRFGMGYNNDRLVQEQADYDYQSTTFSFNPTVTYMVMDNLEFGVMLDIDDIRMDETTNLSPLTRTRYDRTEIGFGLFAQKYFPLNNWFAFYTAANLGLVTGSYDTYNYSSSSVPVDGGDVNGVRGGLNFGFGFTPYNAFALWSNIAGITLSNVKDNPTQAGQATSSISHSGLNVDKNPISIGVAWYFGRGLWRD